MPNWCNNTLILTHNDRSELERAKAAFDRGELLNEFIPVPEDLKITSSPGTKDEELKELYAANIAKHGYDNWYDFCIGKWGTKWDVGGEGDSELALENNILTLTFDSAWSPPCGAYEAMEAEGFGVTGYYYEPGMQFAGIYSEGNDDYYEDWGNSEGARECLPNELDEMFGIADGQEAWEEEDADN